MGLVRRVTAGSSTVQVASQAHLPGSLWDDKL